MDRKDSIMAMSKYEKKLAAHCKRKSLGGVSKFRKDVTGVLVARPKSPAECGKKDTWEYDGSTRATAWRATIRDNEGHEWYWNWPAFIDDDGDNMPGVDIIDSADYGIDDLIGVTARFYTDPNSHRSKIVVLL